MGVKIRNPETLEQEIEDDLRLQNPELFDKKLDGNQLYILWLNKIESNGPESDTFPKGIKIEEMEICEKPN